MLIDLFAATHDTMSPYAVPTAVTALGILALGLTVFIRERKRAEQHTRALAAASAAEKLAAVGQLASGIAHELKNPLGILLLGLNYLERGPGNAAEHAEVLRMMREAIERADQIICRLLAVPVGAGAEEERARRGGVQHAVTSPVESS